MTWGAVSDQRWRGLARRTRYAVWSFYLTTLVGYPVLAAITAWYWQQWRWPILPFVAVVLAAAFVFQVGVYLILRREDWFERRMVYAAVSSHTGVAVDVVLAMSIPLAWWLYPGMPGTATWPFLAAVLAVDLMMNVLSVRSWRGWAGGSRPKVT